MTKNKNPPRRRKPTERSKEKLVDFILAVISSVTASLITTLVQKLFD